MLKEKIGFDLGYNGQRYYVICREFGPFTVYEEAEFAAENANMRQQAKRLSSPVVKGKAGNLVANTRGSRP